MSLSSISPTPTSPSAGTSTTGTANSAISKLGPDAFLNLLTTQLKNQNPLNPIDDTQSIAELAQFSQLQASTNLESSFSKFQQNFGVVQSAALIGQHVTVSGASSSGGSPVSGTVTGVTITDGTPSFTLKDSKGKPITEPTTGAAATYSASQILSIQPS